MRNGVIYRGLLILKQVYLIIEKVLVKGLKFLQRLHLRHVYFELGHQESSFHFVFFSRIPLQNFLLSLSFFVQHWVYLKLVRFVQLLVLLFIHDIF